MHSRGVHLGIIMYGRMLNVDFIRRFFFLSVLVHFLQRNLLSGIFAEIAGKNVHIFNCSVCMLCIIYRSYYYYYTNCVSTKKLKEFVFCKRTKIIPLVIGLPGQNLVNSQRFLFSVIYSCKHWTKNFCFFFLTLDQR